MGVSKVPRQRGRPPRKIGDRVKTRLQRKPKTKLYSLRKYDSSNSRHQHNNHQCGACAGEVTAEENIAAGRPGSPEPESATDGRTVQTQYSTKRMFPVGRSKSTRSGVTKGNEEKAPQIKRPKRSKRIAFTRQPWGEQEDLAVSQLVEKHGTTKWSLIAQLLQENYGIQGRTGKQCRERWHNHLDPKVKKNPLSDEEEKLIFEGYRQHRNKWAEIARLLHGRTDNSIKNFFYSTLRRQLRKTSKKLKIKGRRKREQGEVTLQYLQQLMKENNLPYSELDNPNVRDMLEYMDKNKGSIEAKEAACPRYSLRESGKNKCFKRYLQEDSESDGDEYDEESEGQEKNNESSEPEEEKREPASESPANSPPANELPANESLAEESPKEGPGAELKLDNPGNGTFNSTSQFPCNEQPAWEEMHCLEAEATPEMAPEKTQGADQEGQTPVFKTKRPPCLNMDLIAQPAQPMYQFPFPLATPISGRGEYIAPQFPLTSPLNFCATPMRNEQGNNSVRGRGDSMYGNAIFTPLNMQVSPVAFLSPFPETHKHVNPIYFP